MFADLKKLIVNNNENTFIKFLQSNSIDITERDEEFGCSLLDWAAICDRTNIVKFLCEEESSLLIPPKNTRSPIHYASRHGSLNSLKILLHYCGELSHLVECKDDSKDTALDLAIEHKHAECARLLVNAGAKLPNDVLPLFQLILPINYTLYCGADRVFQLLTPDEIKALEAGNIDTQAFEKLTLKNKKSFRKQQINNKVFSHVINQENIENFILMLIDKYIYLCNRIYKENRESKHSHPNAVLDQRLKLSKIKRDSLLQMVRLLALILGKDYLDTKMLINPITVEKYLKDFILKKQQEKKRYFGDDLSDNSDSEDEAGYLHHLEHLEDPIDEKTQRHLNVSKKHTPVFWLKTKITTPKDAGLKKKVTTISNQLKNNVDEETQFKKLREIVPSVLNKNLQDRGNIKYDEVAQQKEADELIQNINSCIKKEPGKLEALLAGSKPVFVLGTRGINYMLDRWNAEARRYHRQIDERQHPQFSEAVLKTLPYDYYTELDPEHDYHHEPDNHLALQKEALRLSQFLQSLNDTTFCIANSANHKDVSYLFNSVGDCLQDHFSNGVDDHLDDLANKRKNYLAYWGKNLKNSFNSGIAIGSRPYHALKYTFFLKSYYPRSMVPRYWNDGTLEHSHLGKVYLSLHPLQEILAKTGPNNISIQDRQARVSIADLISPEKELSFLGFMPGDRIFHQFVAKFPSFKGAWKYIYKIKYGIDKETYEAFQYLINVTSPESDFRNALMDLLAEWLCAYHEVLLVEIAKEEALCRGGILAYVDREGKLTLKPENGRIFTRGESNQVLRNELHTLRNLRIELANLINVIQVKNINNVLIPGFNLIETKHVLDVLKQQLQNASFLQNIANQIQLTTEEEADLFVNKKTITEDQKKEAYGKKIVENILKHGFYSSSHISFVPPHVTHIVDKGHLYTDLEIDILLKRALMDKNIYINAAMHPLVQGELGQGSRQLFIDELKSIFTAQLSAVIPIEISQEKLTNEAQLRMVGTHWIGLVIRPMVSAPGASVYYRVEIMDPAYSPSTNTDLTSLSLDQILLSHGVVVSQLIDLLRQAAMGITTIQVHRLKTEQQAGDLDCGPWTVDNLIRRAQNYALRTRTQITGQELRQIHGASFQQALQTVHEVPAAKP